MALPDTKLDFSKEDWDTPVEFFEGCWVIANKHAPGLNHAMEVNNRTFVFRLQEKGAAPTLVVFGCADAPVVAAVRKLSKQTGIPVGWVVGNGGAHHLFLGLWYEGFPDARVLVPAQRVPFTRNGRNLAAEYPDRWELMRGTKPAQLVEAFGDRIDVVIFDQLFGYTDATSAEAMGGGALDYSLEPTNIGGFRMMMRMGKMMKDTSQPTDEVTWFHRPSGLVIGGHNYQFSYAPKGYSPPPRFALKTGGFPVNLMFKLMMPQGVFKSSLEGTPGPIADSRRHLEQWEAVLAWDMRAWTSAHDPVTICGPDLTGEELEAAIRASLHRSGEDDPTGARLKWNLKHGIRPQPVESHAT